MVWRLWSKRDSGGRQRCVMSPWRLFVYGMTDERINGRSDRVRYKNDKKWRVPYLLNTDDLVWRKF